MIEHCMGSLSNQSPKGKSEIEGELAQITISVGVQEKDRRERRLLLTHASEAQKQYGRDEGISACYMK